MAYESTKEQTYKDDETVNMHLKRLADMESKRKPWESHWQECADYALPRKNDITSIGSQGNKRNLHLYDTTALQSNDLLASALHGMLTNPASYFFGISSGDEATDADDDARFWLQDSAMRMHSVLNNSNFQTEVHEVYVDLDCFGTAGIDTMEDEEDVVFFKSRFIQELFVAENNRGFIDTNYRLYKWTAKQIVEEFGEANVGKKCMEIYRDKPLEELEILHAIFPRSLQAIQGKTGAKNFKFGSTFILKDHKKKIKEAGFREFPVAIPRWSKASGEVFGRSPTMTALPDIKMINEMSKTMIEGAQRAVMPAVQMPDKGFILPMKLTPNGVNYYRAGSQDRITPIFNDTRIDFGMELMENVRRRIQQCYYVDQLQLNVGPQMTATEVMQRMQDKLVLMGPMLGRQQSEFLRPVLNRVFSIMMRRGLFLPQPTILQGKRVDFKYSSAIAKAQRMSEAQNSQRFIGAVAPIAQVDPTIMDNLNGDEYLRYQADIYGLPQKLLHNRSVVAETRQARSEAQAQAAQLQQEATMAEGIGQVLPAVAKAREAGIA
jgi:hypothetical protein